MHEDYLQDIIHPLSALSQLLFPQAQVLAQLVSELGPHVQVHAQFGHRPQAMGRFLAIDLLIQVVNFFQQLLDEWFIGIYVIHVVVPLPAGLAYR
jgi:hypothetical protein